MSGEMIDHIASAMEQAMVNASPERAQCSRDLSRILARAAIDAMNAFLIEAQRKAQMNGPTSVDNVNFAENLYRH